jgi:hypothetical protein
MGAPGFLESKGGDNGRCLLAEAGCQFHRIFDGLARSLPEIRGHRMGRVPEERHSPYAPVLPQRIPVKDIGAQDGRGLGGGDQRLDGLESAGA